MSKIISVEEAVAKVKDGACVMVGGFLAVGSPTNILKGLAESGVKDLTLICNDTAFVDKGVGPMVVNHQFKKAIVTHIGTNKETGRQMNEGELEVVLTPQGSFVEKIRCGGFGLGGVLTPTGIGTDVEKGKQRLTVNGKDYLLEEPLRGDVSLIKAKKADKFGNLVFHAVAENFNNVMAYASDCVIVEADEIVEVGELDHDEINVPGVVVDYIVDGGAK